MRPALRIVCETHGRGIAFVVHEDGRIIYRTSAGDSIPLVEITDLYAPGQCPKCDGQSLIPTEFVRRDLRARTRVLRVGHVRGIDYDAAGRYPPEAFEASEFDSDPDAVLGSE